jgi:hypothetical protein
MAYIIGLMATKDNVPILDADVVDINTTFSIVNDFDESKTYTIVDSPDPYCSYRLNNWDNSICSSGKAS